MVKTIRPLLSRLTIMPIADDRIFAAVERLHRNLDGVRQLLTNDRMSSVRLVVNPEKMVIAEARRTYTYLSLFGYRVDAVVVNRIIPEEVNDPYFGKWKDIQAEHLATMHESFAPDPDPHRAAVRPGDRRDPVARPTGGGGLRRPRRDGHPASRRADPDPQARDRLRAVDAPAVRGPDQTSTCSARRDELFVRVGPYKRNLILPQVLQRLDVQEASFVDDRLEVLFAKGTAKAAGSAG